MCRETSELAVGTLILFLLAGGKLLAAGDGFQVKSEPQRVTQDNEVAGDGQQAPSAALRRFNKSGRDIGSR
jgi:hypothetical protein